MLCNDEIGNDNAPEVRCIGANCVLNVPIEGGGGDAKCKEGIFICFTVGIKVPGADDIEVHATMGGSALEKDQGILHNIQQLHRMAHLAEPISDALAIGVVIEVNGQIDEV